MDRIVWQTMWGNMPGYTVRGRRGISLLTVEPGGMSPVLSGAFFGAQRGIWHTAFIFHKAASAAIPAGTKLRVAIVTQAALPLIVAGAPLTSLQPDYGHLDVHLAPNTLYNSDQHAFEASLHGAVGLSTPEYWTVGFLHDGASILPTAPGPTPYWTEDPVLALADVVLAVNERREDR